MKKYFLRITALAVCIVTAFTAASCAKSADKKTDGTTVTATDETSEELGLPDTKYDGATVSFLVRGGGNEWDCIDIFMDEEATDRVSDAIINRNIAIEEKYDMEMKQTFCSVDECNAKIQELSLSADGTYDVFINSQYGLYKAAVEGYLLDMNTLKYTDFEKSWWDRELNDNISLGNHQYFAVSSANLMSYYATWIVAYNMNIFKDLNYDPNEPYQLVRDGEWTLDRYISYQKDYTKDINNDNVINDADRWGTAGQSDHILGLLYGADWAILKKDESDIPRLVLPDNKSLDAVTKIMQVCLKGVGFDSHDTSVNTQYSSNGEYGRTMFAEDRAMFFHETLQAVATLRNMNGEFGVVPVPKRDEEQKNYISMVHYWAMSMNAVPSWSTTTDMTGVILEALAYYSAKDVVPEFLTSAVYGKYLRDDASYEMMSYVNENRFIDYGIVTQIGGISGVVKSGIYDGTLNYQRIIDSVKGGVNDEMDALAEQLLG